MSHSETQLAIPSDALGKLDNEREVSSRPGRIDLAVELGLLDEDRRRRLAKRLLVDCPDKIDELIDQGDGDTPAQFIERCSSIALEHYWRNYNPQIDVNDKFRYVSKAKMKTLNATSSVLKWSSEGEDNGTYQ